MKAKNFTALIAILTLIFSTHSAADDYQIDTKGAHASIQFRIQHLGYSWLTGRFNKFDGTFSYDEGDINATKVNVSIDPASVDSNHAERDKHLKNADFLDVKRFPTAQFSSTGIKQTENGSALLTGDLTLHGVTRSIDIKVQHIGAGKDPWGGFRRGFEGTTTLTLKDFNINFDLGPSSTQVELYLYIEGVRID